MFIWTFQSPSRCTGCNQGVNHVSFHSIPEFKVPTLHNEAIFIRSWAPVNPPTPSVLWWDSGFFVSGTATPDNRNETASFGSLCSSPSVPQKVLQIQTLLAAFTHTITVETVSRIFLVHPFATDAAIDVLLVPSTSLAKLNEW